MNLPEHGTPGVSHRPRGSLITLSVAMSLAACNGGSTSVDECQERCERVAALCGAPADSCPCSPAEVDRANRCADRTGCADRISAANDCFDELTTCDA